MKAHGKDVKPLDKDAMLEYVQKSGGKVIAKKGATFYAVSATVCQLVGLILAASDSLATVSSMLHGEYGIEDVCLSTLTLVGPNGTQGKVQMRMNKEEVELLKKSSSPRISAQEIKVGWKRKADFSRSGAVMTVPFFSSTPQTAV